MFKVRGSKHYENLDEYSTVLPDSKEESFSPVSESTMLGHNYETKKEIIVEKS